MPVLAGPPEATHDIGSTRFRSLATPTRGSRETAVWQVEIDPGAPATPHTLTREEVFVVLEGLASVEIDGVRATARAGDAIVVPPHTVFSIGNVGSRPLRLVWCMPVGGQGCLLGGEPFTPPWAE